MLHIVRNKLSLSTAWGRMFFVTLAFVTLASGLFWLDFFRGYSTEVMVLVVSKAETASLGQTVASDLAELAKTLSFYDRVLAGSDLIDDDFEGYAPDERKDLWHDSVSVKQQEGSGVLVVKANAETTEKSKRLASETAQTLFSTAGFYYNVKTDIDMRIIDGPIVKSRVLDPIFFGVTSLVSGLLVTIIFFLLLEFIPRFLGKRKGEEFHTETERHAVPEKAYPQFAVGETVPWIDPKKFVPAKPNTLSFEKSFPEKKEIPEVKRDSTIQPKEYVLPLPIKKEGTHKIISHSRSAQAPANLPVAEMDLPLAIIRETEVVSSPPEIKEVVAVSEKLIPAPSSAKPVEKVEEKSAEKREAKSEMKSEVIFSQKQGEALGFPSRGEHVIKSPQVSVKETEPTVAEYKRRLNELLSGGK